MRVLLAAVLLSVAFAARAADVPVGNSNSGFDVAQRAEMVWFYDDQPGVVVRAYWSAPWHNHHYYPFTGIRPRLGRRENLSAPSRPSKPAQTYSRTWDNNWAFEHSFEHSPVIVVPPGDQSGVVNQDGSQQDSHARRRHDPHVHHHIQMH